MYKVAPFLFIALLITGCQVHQTNPLVTGYVRVKTLQGNGSGTVIHSWEGEDGYYSSILTASHFILTPDNITVNVPIFENDVEKRVERYYPAVLKEANYDLDYAILVIKTKNYIPPVRTATRKTIRNIKIGQTAWSVGSPKGMNIWATKGVVSNIGSNETHLGHDSKIFLGNSGGPLYNSYGEQIGVNVRLSYYEAGPDAVAYLPHIAFALRLDKVYEDLGSYKTRIYFGEEKW